MVIIQSLERWISKMWKTLRYKCVVFDKEKWSGIEGMCRFLLDPLCDLVLQSVPLFDQLLEIFKVYFVQQETWLGVVRLYVLLSVLLSVRASSAAVSGVM